VGDRAAGRSAGPDTAAVAALARGRDRRRLLPHARPRAVEALAELPAASAAAPVAAALRDTTAQVRARRHHGAGPARRRTAAELARTTFHNDPNYEVRAARAHRARPRRPTARDSAIGLGIATPSYQDVIRSDLSDHRADGRYQRIPRIETALATDRLAAQCWRRWRPAQHPRARVLAAHLNDDPDCSSLGGRGVPVTLPRQLGIPCLEKRSLGPLSTAARDDARPLQATGCQLARQRELERLDHPATNSPAVRRSGGRQHLERVVLPRAASAASTCAARRSVASAVRCAG